MWTEEEEVPVRNVMLSEQAIDVDAAPTRGGAVHAGVMSAAKPTHQHREAVLGANGKLQLIRDAKARGYEGDTCPECGALTMVRNGACLKCISCGATSGCS